MDEATKDKVVTMKEKKSVSSAHQLWAELRFAVIGPLLAQEIPKGELEERIEKLAKEKWVHPQTGEFVSFAESTIEGWYYKAKKGKLVNPVAALRTKVRSDFGRQRSLSEEVKNWLIQNHRQHSSWSYQLHCDNLGAWLKRNSGTSGAPEMPSYPSIVRFMNRKGLWKTMRARSPNSPGLVKARERLENREVRSFEVEYVGSLWHLDFHHCSRQIVSQSGKLVTPICLCILDDHSRLAAHVQWYLHETTKVLVHGMIQALQKRGLPRVLMSDNGSAMISDEFTQGLLRLGITHETTLPHSPYQNGKQESFWGSLEGRLMAMLEGEKDLNLPRLNQLTQVWVGKEYNLHLHKETGATPLERFIHGKDVSRLAPDMSKLVACFRRDVKRTLRRSDQTISLEGKRFEIPSAYRTLKTVIVRYARWDLSQIHLIDAKTMECLVQIYPVDLQKNADGKRRFHAKQLELPLIEHKQTEAPLMTKLIADYSATGLPPAYIPMPEEEQ